MKTTIEELEDKFLVTLEGELDTASAAEVQEVQALSGHDVITRARGCHLCCDSVTTGWAC